MIDTFSEIKSWFSDISVVVVIFYDRFGDVMCDVLLTLGLFILIIFVWISCSLFIVTQIDISYSE